MSILEWKDEFSVGDALLDDQHRRLLELINQFSDEAPERTDLRFLLTTMESLIEYADRHFTAEEKRLRAANYPKLAEHQRQHIAFAEELLQLQERLEGSGSNLRQDIERFLKNWFMSHVVGSDQDYKSSIAGAAR